MAQVSDTQGSEVQALTNSPIGGERGVKCSLLILPSVVPQVGVHFFTPFLTSHPYSGCAIRIPFSFLFQRTHEFYSLRIGITLEIGLQAVNIFQVIILCMNVKGWCFIWSSVLPIFVLIVYRVALEKCYSCTMMNMFILNFNCIFKGRPKSHGRYFFELWLHQYDCLLWDEHKSITEPVRAKTT